MNRLLSCPGATLPHDLRNRMAARGRDLADDAMVKVVLGGATGFMATGHVVRSSRLMFREIVSEFEACDGSAAMVREVVDAATRAFEARFVELLTSVADPGGTA